MSPEMAPELRRLTLLLQVNHDSVPFLLASGLTRVSVVDMINLSSLASDPIVRCLDLRNLKYMCEMESLDLLLGSRLILCFLLIRDRLSFS